MIIETDIELGKKYKDETTGFEGTAVAISKHWHGPVQVQIVAKRPAPSDSPVDAWFIVDRLKPTSG